jgi:hypothetical protein
LRTLAAPRARCARFGLIPPDHAAPRNLSGRLLVKRPIPFPVQTAPGAKSQESGGRIINGYVEELGDQAPNKTVIRRGPGLLNFGTSARTGYRGSIVVNGVLYVGFSGKLEKWTSAGGASVNVGNLNGTKRGFFAANNNTTPDKVFVDPDGNIATFTPTAVTNSYPDADLPSVNSVDFLDGYLVFTTGDGRAFATDLNSTSVNALSFGKAEAKPDGSNVSCPGAAGSCSSATNLRKCGPTQGRRRSRSRDQRSFLAVWPGLIASLDMRTGSAAGLSSSVTITLLQARRLHADAGLYA